MRHFGWGKLADKGVGRTTADPADSLASYIASPTGSYVASRSAAVFWATEALSVLLFWGHPDEADAEFITVAVPACAAQFGHPPAMLLDLRGLEFLDLRAFEILSSGLVSKFGSQSRLCTRQAIVTPRGSVGAIVGQFFEFPSGGSCARSFTDAGDALVWTGVRDPKLLDDLERIPRISSLVSSMLTRLRTELERRPPGNARDLARRFGVSQRTLQRRLRELGTTFQEEVTAAHLRIARRLMRETTHPLKWIAAESGYGSLQHFSSSFRARVGLSPSEWRANIWGMNRGR
jgi:AraC-like DNA-binding protein